MVRRVESVDYGHLMGREDLRDGVEEFNMDVTYPITPSIFLTEDEFRKDKTRLETPPCGLRTFVIGTFTAFFDPNLRRLPDEYIALIEGIHQFYEAENIDSYSCFRRERYGEVGISSEHATILDRLALDTSHFLTVLPDASDSAGTWKEITHATKRGTTLVCLNKDENPEMKFRGRVMEAAAVHGGKSELIIVRFNNQKELFSGLTTVTNELRDRLIA